MGISSSRVLKYMPIFGDETYDPKYKFILNAVEKKKDTPVEKAYFKIQKIMYIADIGTIVETHRSYLIISVFDASHENMLQRFYLWSMDTEKILKNNGKGYYLLYYTNSGYQIFKKNVYFLVYKKLKK